LPPLLPLLYLTIQQLALRQSNRGLAPQLAAPRYSGHIDYSVFNLASTLVLRVDIYILSRVLNPMQLAGYIAIQKLFALVFIGPQTLLSTVHPRFSALFFQGNHKKLKSLAITYGLLPSVVLIIATICIISFDANICTLVTAGHLSKFGVGVTCLACVYYVIRVWTDSWSTVLLATNRARKLLLPTILQGVISAPILYWLGSILGIAGGYSGLIIAFVLTTSWWAPIIVLNESRNIREDQ
jgi:O-antigen/teichoic acid export membrane protein